MECTPWGITLASRCRFSPNKGSPHRPDYALPECLGVLLFYAVLMTFLAVLRCQALLTAGGTCSGSGLGLYRHFLTNDVPDKPDQFPGNRHGGLFRGFAGL